MVNARMMKAVDWAGKDLHSWKVYLRELGTAIALTDRFMKGLQYLIEEDRMLTEKLIDDDKTKRKGLRTRVDEEGKKMEQILAQQKELEGLWANVRIDTEVLAKRQREMNARIRELERWGLAPRR